MSRIRVNMSIEERVWNDTKELANNMGVSASSYVQNLLGQQNMMLRTVCDKLMSMSKDELQEQLNIWGLTNGNNSKE